MRAPTGNDCKAPFLIRRRTTLWWHPHLSAREATE
jgi:hypothetical protein